MARCKLVSHLVAPNYETSHFTRLIRFKLFAKTRELDKAIGSASKFDDDPGTRFWSNWF